MTGIMRNVLAILLLALLCAVPTLAQDREAETRARFPYDKMAAQIPGLTVEDYETAIRLVAQMPDLVAMVEKMAARPMTIAPSTVMQPSAFVPLYYPPPPLPAVPPVPRITYPTTRGIYQWEAAHLRNGSAGRR
jgi:hypothetical protein